MATPAGTPHRQRERGWMRYPSGGLLRWFYKAPLVEWRLGLGPLLRRFRLLVLTTRGRKTGKPQHTMLEHSMMDGKAYIAPGWGQRTQWYQNIFADPRVTVQRGGKPYGAIARRVAADDGLKRLYDMMHGKSPVWRQYLESWGVEDTAEAFVANKDRLIVLQLDPIEGVPLPGIRTDLVWIYP